MGERLRVSRFANLTWIGSTIRIVDSITGGVFETEDTNVLIVMGAFSSERDVDEVQSELQAATSGPLIDGLVGAGCLVSATIEHAPSRSIWSPKDRLFHAELREVHPLGPPKGTDTVEPPPAVKPAMSNDIVNLAVARTDTSFRRVLSERRSVRTFSSDAIDLKTLGALFDLAARNKGEPRVVPLLTGEDFEITSRAYPSGGAAYPLEVYVAVSPGGVSGLDSGLYHYCPQRHLLERLSMDGSAVIDAIGTNAQMAGGTIAPPQVVLLVTARMGRLARYNKYGGGLAYGLMLQELGCFQQTLYLVAALLKIGPCALGGCVSSAALHEAVGVDAVEEPTVGFFMLGPPA